LESQQNQGFSVTLEIEFSHIAGGSVPAHCSLRCFERSKICSLRSLERSKSAFPEFRLRAGMDPSHKEGDDMAEQDGFNGLFSEDTKLTIEALVELKEALREIRDVLIEVRTELQEIKAVLEEA